MAGCVQWQVRRQFLAVPRGIAGGVAGFRGSDMRGRAQFVDSTRHNRIGTTRCAADITSLIMLLLAYKNLVRRPLRNGLTIAGLAVAVAVLACLSAFGNGYRHELGAELDRMGVQLLLVPLGCP